MDTPIIDALLELRKSMVRHAADSAGLEVAMGRYAGLALEQELVKTNTLNTVRIDPATGERSTRVADMLVRWPV